MMERTSVSSGSVPNGEWGAEVQFTSDFAGGLRAHDYASLSQIMSNATGSGRQMMLTIELLCEVGV